MRGKVLGENVRKESEHIFDDSVEESEEFFGGELHDFSIQVNYPDDLLLFSQ